MMIDFSPLIAVLIMVESSGNDLAIGDNGDSVGCLQIQMGVIKDVNRIYTVTYKEEDRYNRSSSKDICQYYLNYWVKKAYVCVEFPKDQTFNVNEIAARIWNGGPNGFKKNNTIKYWNKVKRIGKELGYDLSADNID